MCGLLNSNSLDAAKLLLAPYVHINMFFTLSALLITVVCGGFSFCFVLLLFFCLQSVLEKNCQAQAVIDGCRLAVLLCTLLSKKKLMKRAPEL